MSFHDFLQALGPREFKLKGKIYTRKDIKIKNKRGLTLECSHFEPAKRVAKQLPCVIYLHGNCSSRIEALPAVEVLLPANITLFCFDFSGCGLSEGEYISLGWFEREDVEAVIDHLRKTEQVSTIGLWGRSMGAATALMHSDKDPSIAGIVVDSAFSDLRVLAEELAKTHAKIPKFITSGALSILRKTIQSKAQFDINQLVPMNSMTSGFIPAFFVTGKDDTFILPHHTQDLYNKYAGDKNLVLVEGDHNSPRPQFLLDSIVIFFYNTLLCDTLPKDDAPVDKGKSKSHTGDLALAESYLKHNSKKAEQNFGVGNEGQVIDAFGDFKEEELKLAMEESLRLAREEEEKARTCRKKVTYPRQHQPTKCNMPNKGDSAEIPVCDFISPKKIENTLDIDEDEFFVHDDSNNPYTKAAFDS